MLKIIKKVGGIFLTIIACIGLLLVNFVVFINYNAGRKLRQEGTNITALVRSKATSGTQRSRAKYYMTYQYNIDNKTYTQRKRIDNQLYFGTTEGEDVEVVYMPQNPNHSDIRVNRYESMGLMKVLVIDCFIFGISFWYYWRRKNSRY